MPFSDNKKPSRKSKILPQFYVTSGGKPLLDLLEIQRQSFFAFLENGIVQELSKTETFQETAKTSAYTRELELTLKPETYKLISPICTPKQAILNGSTYACKLYVQATLTLRSKPVSVSESKDNSLTNSSPSSNWTSVTTRPTSDSIGSLVISDSSSGHRESVRTPFEVRSQPENLLLTKSIDTDYTNKFRSTDSIDTTSSRREENEVSDVKVVSTDVERSSKTGPVIDSVSSYPHGAANNVTAVLTKSSQCFVNSVRNKKDEVDIARVATPTGGLVIGINEVDKEVNRLTGSTNSRVQSAEPSGQAELPLAISSSPLYTELITPLSKGKNTSELNLHKGAMQSGKLIAKPILQSTHARRAPLAAAISFPDCKHWVQDEASNDKSSFSFTLPIDYIGANLSVIDKVNNKDKVYEQNHLRARPGSILIATLTPPVKPESRQLITRAMGKDRSRPDAISTPSSNDPKGGAKLIGINEVNKEVNGLVIDAVSSSTANNVTAVSTKLTGLLKRTQSGEPGVRSQTMQSVELATKQPVDSPKNWSIQKSSPWIFLGELPLMTKRGHFILNGSPRVIINQITRCPGIYFQEKRRGVGFEQEVRVSADFIPQRGPWLRIQSDWEGRFWARLKREGRVKYTTLYEAFQEFEKQYTAPLINLVDNSNTSLPKSEIVAFQERKTKEDRQKKALLRLFKNSTRYNLGKLGRFRINERVHNIPRSTNILNSIDTACNLLATRTELPIESSEENKVTAVFAAATHARRAELPTGLKILDTLADACSIGNVNPVRSKENFVDTREGADSKAKHQGNKDKDTAINSHGVTTNSKGGVRQLQDKRIEKKNYAIIFGDCRATGKVREFSHLPVERVQPAEPGSIRLMEYVKDDLIRDLNNDIIWSSRGIIGRVSSYPHGAAKNVTAGSTDVELTTSSSKRGLVPVQSAYAISSPENSFATLAKHEFALSPLRAAEASIELLEETRKNQIINSANRFLAYTNKSCLMAADIDAVHTCLERLLGGGGLTDDIDHLKNRLVRTSGELLQQQLELGLSRLNEVMTPLLRNLIQGQLLSFPLSHASKDETSHALRTYSVSEGTFRACEAAANVQDVEHNSKTKEPLATHEGSSLLSTAMSTSSSAQQGGLVSGINEVDKEVNRFTKHWTKLTLARG